MVVVRGGVGDRNCGASDLVVVSLLQLWQEHLHARCGGNRDERYER